jgi:DNA (cytosine-5)-methyltransferase 1
MPRLLDLFSGAGGAAMGYHRAGFDEIVGVDNRPQPRYPFAFVQGDALDYLAAHGREFDAIHASPPCQAFTALKTMWNSREHADLVEPTRGLLRATTLPWVIENVPGAPLARGAAMLCGTMFNLGTNDGRAELRRHRYFELSHALTTLIPECAHGGITVGVYGDGNGRDYRRDPVVIGVYGRHGRDRRRIKPSVGVYGHAGGKSVRDGTQQFSTKERGEAMGIDWMTSNELSQAIPPAYTQWIGARLLAAMASHA